MRTLYVSSRVLSTTFLLTMRTFFDTLIITKGGVFVNTRIKKIRENEGLTQEEFGKRIGSARNTIANYETGNRSPSNAVITSICREFNINEEWLRTGEGEMRIKRTRNQELQAFANDVMEDVDESFKKRFVLALSKLNESDWETLKKIADELSKES